ncbi:MAG: ATP synthase F1 subunit epsilon [Polyangia bacterium]
MLKLHVVTPTGQALDREVDEVTVPGLLGELGILPGHVPLLAATKAGVLRYRRGTERGRMALGPGFAEVDGKDTVLALVQKAADGESVNVAAAEELLASANERLKGDSKDSQEAQAAAAADRDWALAQLEVKDVRPR